MYTGITKGLFTVSKVTAKTNLIEYSVLLNAELIQGLTVGASVNIDGVCQTVTHIQENTVSFAAMAETCRLTTLDKLFTGRQVSVERSLKFGDEIGGHLIAGHVTGTASVYAVQCSDNNLAMTLKCPSEWMQFILPKGFIAIDGSSLTIGNTDAAGFFDIHLIPETLRLTNFGNKKIGDRVNMELDHQVQAIIRTVENFLAARAL